MPWLGLTSFRHCGAECHPHKDWSEFLCTDTKQWSFSMMHGLWGATGCHIDCIYPTRSHSVTNALQSHVHKTKWPHIYRTTLDAKDVGYCSKIQNMVMIAARLRLCDVAGYLTWSYLSTGRLHQKYFYLSLKPREGIYEGQPLSAKISKLAKGYLSTKRQNKAIERKYAKQMFPAGRQCCKKQVRLSEDPISAETGSQLRWFGCPASNSICHSIIS